jgi:CheY-like chemotaxis protein
LGLTLVRNLVRLHGGKVTARSDGPGTGSEFEVIIPVAKEGPTDAAEPALSAMARQVLVVDDETDVADMFAAMLENLGQKVVVAYSGEQAIAAACRQKPEIAFLDLRMPGMGGSELARQLREHLGTDKLCLVALSGYSVDTRSDMAEFDRHLLKPATRESVVALLNGLAG